MESSIYERAIRYDPENADYHFVLGQIYNYSTEHLNINRAREEYEAAVRLNPDRSAHWLELSKYHEQQGNIEGARHAMIMALEKDPNYAQTHWAAANLYIRIGDLRAADLELRRSADLDVSYVAQVLDLVWRFYGDPLKILSVHVPNTKAANLRALDFFMSKKSEQGAALAWQRLKISDTTPRERFSYMDYLVTIGKTHEAWKVFSFPSADLEPLFNSSFETEPMNGGFDWHFETSDTAAAQRDTTEAKDGAASFIVSFSGRENVNYNQLWHWLPIDEGKQYVLKFWMKTDGISTDEGMFVDVDGHASPKQTGTKAWQEYTIPFVAKSDLATVRLRRLPSRKFDNLLKGKVWVDDFSLVRVR